MWVIIATTATIGQLKIIIVVATKPGQAMKEVKTSHKINNHMQKRISSGNNKSSDVSKVRCKSNSAR